MITMKIRALLILILVATATIHLPCTATTSRHAVTDSLMAQLEAVIAGRDVYLQQKQSELDSLHRALDTARDDRAMFYALDHLYNAYHPFNTDSAYNISTRLETVARRTGDSGLILNALLHRANIMTATGMYNESLETISHIHLSDLPQHLVAYYFHTKRITYGLLADYAAFEPERQRYRRLTDMYRDSIMACNDSNSLPYVITKADRYNVEGKPHEAIATLTRFLAENTLSDHDIAICTYSLSEAYGKSGDTESQKQQLIISSIGDLRSSVLEYVSLRELALLLYGEGDLDRAYRFLTIAANDAEKCNARLRIIELNKAYTTVNGIYVDTVRNKKRTLEYTIAIITLLSAVLVALLLYTRKQMVRIARARRSTEEALRQLNELHVQLKHTNEELQNANSAIAENSELKEVYIGRYMDQCLDYIERLDTYRKTVGKLINTGKTDQLKQLVKSPSQIETDIKTFYDEFDRTFLSIFPNFVADFNRLLLPGEAIVPKREGSLNTELRIFALIRLGITDSDRIAKFLRYSLTTIYNYRTKVRNKAAGDRNQLESEVMRIGRASR